MLPGSQSERDQGAVDSIGQLSPNLNSIIDDLHSDLQAEMREFRKELTITLVLAAVVVVEIWVLLGPP